MAGRRTTRIGLDGAAGVGKTTLIAGLVPHLVEAGHAPLVIGGGEVLTTAAIEALEAATPAADLLLIEGATAADGQPLPTDYVIGVVDVAGGARLAAMLTAAPAPDMLVVTKVDLAPALGADLHALARAALRLGAGRPAFFVDGAGGDGLEAIVDRLHEELLPPPVVSEWISRWDAL